MRLQVRAIHKVHSMCRSTGHQDGTEKEPMLHPIIHVLDDQDDARGP